MRDEGARRPRARAFPPSEFALFLARRRRHRLPESMVKPGREFSLRERARIFAALIAPHFPK